MATIPSATARRTHRAPLKPGTSAATRLPAAASPSSTGKGLTGKGLNVSASFGSLPPQRRSATGASGESPNPFEGSPTSLPRRILPDSPIIHLTRSLQARKIDRFRPVLQPQVYEQRTPHFAQCEHAGPACGASARALQQRGMMPSSRGWLAHRTAGGRYVDAPGEIEPGSRPE
jgi:hypothetical protein